LGVAEVLSRSRDLYLEGGLISHFLRIPRSALRAWSVSTLVVSLLIGQSVAAPQPAQSESSRKRLAGRELVKLMKLNSEALFGANVAVKKRRMRVVYSGADLSRGFEISGPKDVFSTWGSAHESGVLSKLGGAGLDEESFVLAAKDGAIVRSRFPLHRDFRIRFKLRIEELSPRSAFGMTLNRSGKGNRKSLIATGNFFDEVVVDPGGGKKRRQPASEAYRVAPRQWFDTKVEGGVAFSLKFRDGKLTISTLVASPAVDDAGSTTWKPQKIVALDEIESPQWGEFEFRFSGMTFVLRDLVIESKIPRAWVEQRIEELREAGELQMPLAPEVVKRKKTGAGKGIARKGSRATAGSGVTFDEPDPEINEKL